MSDKPSFLIGVDETPAEKEIMDVLRDEPTPAPTEGEKPNENPQPGQSDTKPEGNGGSDGGSPTDGADSQPPTGDDTKPSDDSSGDGTDGGDSNKPPVAPPADKKPDEKTPEEKETPEQAAQRQINLKFGTFKSAEDAERAFKEMQRTLTRLTTEQKKPGAAPEQQSNKGEQDNLSKFTQIAKTQPLVDVKVPKAENYRFDDGSFDLDSYGRDLVRNTIMAIQQSLVGGQLGAMQFGLLQEAMNQEYQAGMQTSQAQERASTVEKQIYKDYPIFKTNTKAAALLEKAIYGEVARRNSQAQASGKEAEPLKEEEFLAIAKDLVENFNIPVAPATQDPADTPHMTPTMQPTGRGKLSPVEQDIEDMMNVKSKSGSIF